MVDAVIVESDSRPRLGRVLARHHRRRDGFPTLQARSFSGPKMKQGHPVN